MKVFYYLLAVGFLFWSCQKDDDNSINLESGECWVEIDSVFVLTEIDQAPVFKDGGEEGFGMALISGINYPAEARENGIEGLVTLEYEITITGSVENIVIAEDIGGGCGEVSKTTLEAITVGESFFPAELAGEKVRVKKEVPIRFKLE